MARGSAFANMTPEQRKENLDKARAARESNKAAGITTTKKMTRARAIKAKCKDCCTGSVAEVRRCHIVKCPLWAFRCKNPENMEATPEEVQGIETPESESDSDDADEEKDFEE